MNRVLAALHRAINHRDDQELAPVAVTPCLPPPVRAAIVPVVDQADTVTYSIGRYAGDPRITAIGARRIQLDDDRCLRLIPQPNYFQWSLYETSERLIPTVWRMFRPDGTTSIFWWRDPVDALADVIGPAELPTFTPDLALAILTPDSNLLPALEAQHG